MAHDRRAQLREILVLILCIAPFLHLTAFAFEFFIDVPSSDQWGLVELIEKYINGQLSFSDLWEQKNVHRIFFPKLIILTLARATHWNHAYEVAVILACGLITYWLVVGQLVRIYREGAIQRPIGWLNAVLLSCLMFSLTQHRNWLWGMQIQLWLCLAAAVAGIFILSRRLTTRRVVAAIVLGFVATHSFAIGLVYWVVGLLPALLAPASNATQRRWLLAVWLVFGTLAVFSFFYGYSPRDQGLASVIDAPTRHVLYVLAFLGNPIGYASLPLAVAAGVLSLVLLGGLSAYLVRSASVSLRTLLPLLGLALFAVGSAALTAVGRSDLPISQALTSRYVTVAQLIWVSDITLVCLALATRRKSRPSNPFAGAAPSLLLLVLMLGIWIGHLEGMEKARRFSREVNRAGRGVAAKYPDVEVDDMRPLGRGRRANLRRLPILYEYELSLFRPRSPDGRDAD